MNKQGGSSSSGESSPMLNGAPIMVPSEKKTKSFEEIITEQMVAQDIEPIIQTTTNTTGTATTQEKIQLPDDIKNRIGVLPPIQPNQTNVQQQHHTRPKIDYSKLGADSFEKLKVIGRGDVGKVYLCRLKGTELYFAMKVMRKDEMIKRNKVKRVLTEREILSTVDHPFIATLFCSFQTQESLYFVLEYCAGGEFFRVLKKQPSKTLPESTVRFYAAEVLLALEYLHLQGFIYRDLKPENILLHHTGHIRLTDFDLSKQSSQPVTPTLVKSFFSSQKQSKIDIKQIQEFQSFIGTAEYLPPEILSGKGHNCCVDYWTFGILLYEVSYCEMS